MSEPSTREICSLLRQSLLFRSLQDEELAPLAKSVRLMRARPGALLLRRGQPGDAMLIVLSGRVKIVATGERHAELLLNLVEAGQIFGELSVLDGRERSADAIALTEVSLLRIERSAILAFLGVRTDVLFGILGLLCSKLRDTTSMAERAAFLSTPARLFRRFLDLARLDAASNGQGLRVTHRLSQRELGASISASRETVNKILHHWKELGLVETGTGYVWIKDVSALAAEANSAGFADSFGSA
jgi:CRP/FNR family cyclic AMP-dependent transcriptional regulator